MAHEHWDTKPDITLMSGFVAFYTLLNAVNRLSCITCCINRLIPSGPSRLPYPWAIVLCGMPG